MGAVFTGQMVGSIVPQFLVSPSGDGARRMSFRTLDTVRTTSEFEAALRN